MKDSTSGNLDRIQVVKGWSKSGQSFEEIFDVAWSGNRTPDLFTGRVRPVGNPVDIEKATYSERFKPISSAAKPSGLPISNTALCGYIMRMASPGL